MTHTLQEYLSINIIGLSSLLNEKEFFLGEDTYYLGNYESMMDYLEWSGYQKGIWNQPNMVQKMYDDVSNDSFLVYLHYNGHGNKWELEDVDTGTISKVEQFKYLYDLKDKLVKSGEYDYEATLLEKLLKVDEIDQKASADVTEAEMQFMKDTVEEYGFDI